MKKIILFIVLIFSLSSCENNEILDTNTESELPSSDTSLELGEKNVTDNVNELSDVERISNALSNDDVSLLADENEIFVFEEIKRICGEIINEDMNLFEKELAVHDYIIENCTYDLDALDERKTVSQHSSTAYGVLKNGKSICLGYTKTFKIFMDYLGIECIIVEGTANGGEDHAWNMVKIDETWYNVDVTWDDPVPDFGTLYHSYFNATDEYLKDNSHVWDTNLYPEAVTEFDLDTIR